MIQILALYLNFEGAKNIHALHLGLWRMVEVPDWGWRLDLYLDMITVLWYTHDPNFGSLS